MARSNPINSVTLSEINEHLFSEISPEQAAIVEGGLNVAITRIDCLKAGADGFLSGGDDVYVKLNGSRAADFIDSFKTGTSRTLDPAIFSSNSGSSATIDLFDADDTSRDDFLGGFTVSSTGGKVVSKRISGSGSKYRVFYRAA